MAIKSVLTTKVLDGDLVVVDGLSFDALKTQAFLNVLDGRLVHDKALVVLEDGHDVAAQAARNLPNVKVVPAEGIHVLDAVKVQKLILTTSAHSKIEEVLA